MKNSLPKPKVRLSLPLSLLTAALLAGGVTLLALWCQPNSFRSLLSGFLRQPLLIVLNALPAGLLLLALVVAKHRKFDGQIFLGYVAWYGLGRAWIEGLRTDSLYFFSTGLRVSQVLAIVSCAAAVVILFVQLTRPHSSEELWGYQMAARKKAKARTAEQEEAGGAGDDED